MIIKRRNRRRRGVSYIETLMAGLILSIGLMGTVTLWAFSFKVTSNTDERGYAYDIARQAVERTKMSGFTAAPEGPTVTYYNGSATLLANSTGATYKVTVTITSDSMKSGTSGVAGGVPADTALRTVTAVVQRMSDLSTLYQATTYLTENGI